MLSFLKRLIYALSNKIRQRAFKSSRSFSAFERKITLNFAKVKESPFDIKSEISYNSNLSNGSFELGLKKSNCIAWADIPEYKFDDLIIEAKIRLDSFGGYAAAGIIFRITDDTSYYIALVSGKGYFRIDAVKDSAPRPLIAWTELSDFNGTNINLKIITYGTCLIFIVNDKWLGEVNNDSLMQGRLGFALASYEESEEWKKENGEIKTNNEYTCKAYLDYISIDTRIRAVENEFIKWTDDSNINAERRLRLAETFAVMGETQKAMSQINRAWKRRNDVISTVSAVTAEIRTKRELLLAARMSFRLEQYSEAEEFIDSILDQWPDSPEGKLAYTEKLRILNELGKFNELKEFVINNPFKINKDIDYYTFIARCYWELKEYNDSAEAWDKAFEINSENGVYAANAANAYEFADNKEEALTRFIAAGKIFLNQDNKAELAALMPKLSVLGSENWEARTLLGKWAFSLEDYDKCIEEFTIANKLRLALKPRPKADPASYYLWALVLNMQGKNRDTLRLLEKAVELAPDYGLFRFKLAEIKLLNGNRDPDIAEEFKLALEHINDDTKKEMAVYAGNLLLNIGDMQNAAYFLEKAKTN
jgi:tetratricopeptide (TPR) repeat protein